MTKKKCGFINVRQVKERIIEDCFWLKTSVPHESDLQEHELHNSDLQKFLRDPGSAGRSTFCVWRFKNTCMLMRPEKGSKFKILQSNWNLQGENTTVSQTTDGMATK